MSPANKFEWTPTGYEPHDLKDDDEKPIDLTPTIEKLEKAHVEALEDMKTVIADALAEQTELTTEWMKKLEAVLMAKRRVTVLRDEKGLAKQAISEVVGVKT